MGAFEEKYNDTLRHMELSLVRVYRKHDELMDWQVLTAVNALLRTYTAEQRKRQPPAIDVFPPADEAHAELKIVCEGWLGRGPLVDEVGQLTEAGNKALKVSEIVACLKRIRKSNEMWQKEGGRRGYYKFIDQFLPD
ncbi:MAG: hypothetical protein GY943_34155 [Chloroflexi bacterium]|nr:hypothetical protein [Chloroflexota bacterium]